MKADDTSIVREGSGAGEAHEATPGLAHDRAAKVTETDATKRALMTFGNAFGLSLYAGPAEPSPDRARACSSTDTVKSDIQSVDEGKRIVAELKQAEPLSDTTDGAADISERSEWPTVDPFEEAARRAQARTRIDKSQLALSEPRREHNPDHLKRVTSRPCLICGRNRIQAHQLSYLQPRAMGRKVSNEFTVPLCSTHHRELHASGKEKAWWAEQGIDSEPFAQTLWQERRHALARPAVRTDTRDAQSRSD